HRSARRVPRVRRPVGGPETWWSGWRRRDGKMPTYCRYDVRTFQLMFLAIRELRFARGRFALMGAVVALIAILVVLLSGLSVGLANDGVSGLQRLKVSSFAFQENVSKDSAVWRGVVGQDALDTWAAQEGVAGAAPFGNPLVSARTDRGVEIDLALFGVENGSFLDPAVAFGSPEVAEGQVVISST